MNTYRYQLCHWVTPIEDRYIKNVSVDLKIADRHYKLTEKLTRLGYSGICTAFKKFSRMHTSIFSEYRCSVRRYIEEGMCVGPWWFHVYKHNCQDMIELISANLYIVAVKYTICGL